MRRLWFSACAATCLVLAANPALAQSGKTPPATGQSAGLPNLGDGSEMTSSAERRLGDRIVRELYRDPDYIDDPVLFEYVQAICVDRTKTTEGVERGERAQHLRLGGPVLVDALRRIARDPGLLFACEPGLGSRSIGMGLQGQWLRGCHELEEVGQVARNRFQRRSVVELRRCQRMRPHPPLGPRATIGSLSDHRWDRRSVAPRVVLRPSVDCVHASTR